MKHLSENSQTGNIKIIKGEIILDLSPKSFLNRSRIMKTNIFRLILLIALGCLLISACSNGANVGAQENEPTEVPVVKADTHVVVEGRLVPKESVQLSFVTGGKVAEVLVKEGDQVKAGEVLARLGEREQLEANIANAELERLSAEIEATSVDLELTSARLELLEAQRARQAIDENWPDTAIQAEQELTDARQAAHDAERDLGYKTGTADQLDIDVAWSQVVLTEKDLEEAKEKFEPYANKPEDNLSRATYQSKLAQAQKAYDRAVTHYNALKDPSGEFEISQAEAHNSVAQARLAQAEKDYAELIEGPDPDDIQVAEARIANAESQIEAAQARANIVQGRIDAAQANLKAAQAALEELDLVAPFDGTVVDLNLILGEQVTPGNTVATLVDFSQWYIETDNLTEIEVVDVAVGQLATIIPDALLDVSLTGKVATIDDFFVEKRGDVTYTARILMDEIDPRMRWGMTVVVTFEE
jgi:multidrug efflux pump subunit AcrA (membrane-fusion protein)